jgi:hypothetical protein
VSWGERRKGEKEKKEKRRKGEKGEKERELWSEVTR